MIRKNLVSGILSGICIGLGGGVFLSLVSESRIAAAVFFSVALLTICYFGFNLYTGKIGFMAVSHTKDDFTALIWGLCGNILGTLITGVLAGIAVPQINEAAQTAVAAKLLQTPLQTLLRGWFCGLLMFIAVRIFRENKTPTGILFAIPVFILSGYEHSVADMYYCFADGIWSAFQALFVAEVVIGNTVGGLTIPLLMKLTSDKSK